MALMASFNDSDLVCCIVYIRLAFVTYSSQRSIELLSLILGQYCV